MSTRAAFDTLRERGGQTRLVSASKTLREINCMRRVSPSIVPRSLVHSLLLPLSVSRSFSLSFSLLFHSVVDLSF